MPDTVSSETAATSNTSEPIRIGGLDHVVLRVGDLDRAIDFYGKVLGCRVERELQQPRLVQLRAGLSLID
ncbi:MAG TPA: VOC family protein, partial [Stellaceae bacterium]|nr:VOC family protein [Stellaceae bacterium]